jgi:hypothetical protein
MNTNMRQKVITKKHEKMTITKMYYGGQWIVKWILTDNDPGDTQVIDYAEEKYDNENAANVNYQLIINVMKGI